MQTHTKEEVKTLLRQVYDLLMYDIEQDLLLGNIATLEKKYRGESPEERSERLARYREAIETFHKKLSIVMSKWKIDMTACLKDTKMKIEKKIDDMEQRDLAAFDFDDDA